ncbi:MAG: Xaa-Pro peptidase family protein [Chloroflexota bacterium]
MSSGIGAARFEERLGRSAAAVGSAGHGALLIGQGPELEWLTGYGAIGLERLTMLVVPATGRATLVVPRLEVGAASAARGIAAGLVELVSWGETEDAVAIVARILGPARATSSLLVSDGLRAAFLLRLQAALPAARFSIASSVMSPLRQVKDADEVELLRLAAAAADRTVEAMVRGRLIGRTEADLAREVQERLVAEGHDVASFWIVASGPNSASPHHDVSDRVVRAGEPLLFDIGGRRAGYCSDITRTIWVAGAAGQGPDDAYIRLHGLVEESQAAGRAAIRPGIALQDLDRASRAIIDAAGHGEDFFHRLGHGIGLEGHEDPYLVEGNTATLVAGHAFSIEPGIYLEGRYGARIEDIAVCTPDGGETLNQVERTLITVTGE